MSGVTTSDKRYSVVSGVASGADALSSSLAQLLGNPRMGVIQLVQHGRIVKANDRARRLVRKGGGLFDEAGSRQPGGWEFPGASQEAFSYSMPTRRPVDTIKALTLVSTEVDGGSIAATTTAVAAFQFNV